MVLARAARSRIHDAVAGAGRHHHRYHQWHRLPPRPGTPCPPTVASLPEETPARYKRDVAPGLRAPTYVLGQARAHEGPMVHGCCHDGARDLLGRIVEQYRVQHRTSDGGNNLQ